MSQPTGLHSPTKSAVSVLTQIESTASRSARSHDISHMRDRVTNLMPAIPPSLIEGSDHVFETSFLPEPGGVYSDLDGLWHVKVFPSDAPSSRKDAVQLDKWVNRSLEGYRAARGAESKEDLVIAVEALVPILSVALHEVTRQVTHHCAERGRALEKIWKTYVGLFERVLVQMQGALRETRQKSATTQQELKSAKEQRRQLHQDHPHTITQRLKTLEEDFRAKHDRFQEGFHEEEEINGSLKKEFERKYKELEEWFPNFKKYENSSLRNHISPESRVSQYFNKFNSSRASKGDLKPVVAEEEQEGREEAKKEEEAEEDEEAMAPEVALAEDFKRLLTALAPEKRRVLAQELVPLFELDPEAEDEPATIDEQEARTRLRAEIQHQEETIRDLRKKLVDAEAEVAGKPAAAAAGAAVEAGDMFSRMPRAGARRRIATDSDSDAGDTVTRTATQMLAIQTLARKTSADSD